MNQYTVTYLLWRHEGKAKTVTAKNHRSAANKAFAPGSGWAYYECSETGEFENCGQAYKDSPAVKVVEANTGSAQYFYFYDCG